MAKRRRRATRRRWCQGTRNEYGCVWGMRGLREAECMWVRRGREWKSAEGPGIVIPGLVGDGEAGGEEGSGYGAVEVCGGGARAWLKRDSEGPGAASR